MMSSKILMVITPFSLFGLFALASAQLKPGWEKEITTVHLVYMTHLDVGYTLTNISQILDEYITKYFPKAFQTSRILEEFGGPERFSWTTHPWLIMQYLSNSTGKVTARQIEELEHAIHRGWIQWHALPFNLEAEVSEPDLYGYGVQGLAHKLDERFKKSRKIAGSQKDVPGITLGAIDILADNGVHYLNVGVNDFSVPPAVEHGHSVQPYAPSTPFVWRNPKTGKSLICTWSSGYSRDSNKDGETIPELISARPGSKQALVFLMHVDNTGPPTPYEVLKGWEKVNAIFPKGEIIVSSLDNYTMMELIPNKATLPVFDKEIGDFWIRGIGSDPVRMSMFRQVAKLRVDALKSGSIHITDPKIQTFSELLVKQPEHTWGFNAGQLGGHDGKSYSNDFLRLYYETPLFQENLQSYLSQRAWLTKAIDALDQSSPFARSIQAALKNMEPRRPSVGGFKQYHFGDVAMCHGSKWAFDTTGAISLLQREGDPRQWASNTNPIGRILYVLNNNEEQLHYRNRSLWPTCNKDCGGCGFIKCNPDPGGAISATITPTVISSWVLDAPQQCSFKFQLTFPFDLQYNYGAPKTIWLEASLANTGVSWTISYFEKSPTRLPESLWIQFIPKLTLSESKQWELNKLGAWVSPYYVAKNGSQAIHGVWEGLRVPGLLNVSSLEVPLVVLGTPTPLVFLGDESLDPVDVMKNGVSYNIFNNQWTTNYPVFLFDSEFKSTFKFSWDDSEK